MGTEWRYGRTYRPDPFSPLNGGPVNDTAPYVRLSGPRCRRRHYTDLGTLCRGFVWGAVAATLAIMLLQALM
jgi:hypothetical protein